MYMALVTSKFGSVDSSQRYLFMAFREKRDFANPIETSFLEASAKLCICPRDRAPWPANFKSGSEPKLAPAQADPINRVCLSEKYILSIETFRYWSTACSRLDFFPSHEARAVELLDKMRAKRSKQYKKLMKQYALSFNCMYSRTKNWECC